MDEPLSYEVAVVGGGPAGITTALYTTRLGHRTAVFEAGGGRHAAVGHVHNLVGVSEDVSGRQLAELGIQQLEVYGADFYPTTVERVSRQGDDRFLVEASHATVVADRVVFATGFTDVPPDVPGLRRFTGRGLHYCLHCDVYGLGDAPAFVLGHDDHAAQIAMILLNVTGDVDLLLDDREPAWSDEIDAQLRAHPVDRVDAPVASAFPADEDAAQSWLGGLRFADGHEREYRGGFAMYGREYDADVAAELGCSLADDGAIEVDERFETSVDGAYAVGDVTHGQNQTAVAIGDGARAGIALHKDLRRFPASPAELEEGTVDAPACADDLRARMRRLRDRDEFPGLGGAIRENDRARRR